MPGRIKRPDHFGFRMSTFPSSNWYTGNSGKLGAGSTEGSDLIAGLMDMTPVV